MAITINNSLQNINGTPGAASGVFSDRPAAANVAEGTLYFATDTAAIYQAVAGLWVNYAGGGGGSSTGVNGLNGSTNIGLGGTLVNDTVINASNFSLDINDIKTLTLDTQNNDAIVMQDLVSIKTLQQGFERGFLVYGSNFVAGEYQTGDFAFHVNKSNGYLGSQYLGNYIGFYCDFTGFSTGQVKYITGDPTGITGNNSNIEINGSLDSIFIQTNDLKFNLESSIIKSKYSGVDIGINLDFTNSIFTIGDYNNTNNNIQIIIDDVNQYIYATNNSVTGLQLFFNDNLFILGQYSQFIADHNQQNAKIQIDGDANALFYKWTQIIGDVNNVNNGSSMIFNQDTAGGSNYIVTSSQTGENGFKLDFINNFFKFGDFYTGYSLEIDSTNNTTTLFCQNVDILTGSSAGFRAVASGVTKIGDIDGNQNNTWLGVDDTNETLIATNVITGTAGGNSGLHLKININGTDYRIQLLDA